MTINNRHDSYTREEGQTTTGSNGKMNYDDMKYDFGEDAKLREALQRIIDLDSINIEIVGCWIWVDGNTYGYKDMLREIGFKWAREKKKWYFHTEAFRKRSHKILSMDDIRNYYGSTEVEREERRELMQS